MHTLRVKVTGQNRHELARHRRGTILEVGQTYTVPRYRGTLAGVLESFDGAGEMVHLRVISDTCKTDTREAGAIVTVHRNQLEPYVCQHPADSLEAAHKLPPHAPAYCRDCRAVRPDVDTFTDSENRWHAVVTMTRTPNAGDDLRVTSRVARAAIRDARGRKSGAVVLEPYRSRWAQTLTYGDTVTHVYVETSAR